MTSASGLIANARALLLDFDGPVTALMPPPVNAQAADQARAPLSGLDLPDDIASSTDHLAVLRYVSGHHPELLTAVEGACEYAETEAARRSAPSPEVSDWLADSPARGVPVAIVSNNSETAVRTFLDRFGWTQQVAAFACRQPDDPALMKPNPYLIEHAVRLLDVPPADCLLIGDSVSDVAAARAAGVPVVGLAKSAQRATELREAGADALLVRSRT